MHSFILHDVITLCEMYSHVMSNEMTG